MVPRETPQFRRSLGDILETASDKRAETTQGTRREGWARWENQGEGERSVALAKANVAVREPVVPLQTSNGPGSFANRA